MRDFLGAFFTVLAVGFACLALLYLSIVFVVLAIVSLGLGFILFEDSYVV